MSDVVVAMLEQKSSIQESNDEEDSDEEDPLDAFMSGLEQHLQKEKTVKTVDVKVGVKTVPKGTRGDIDDEDDEESYYR